jgi:hypothetical protein
VTYRIEENMNAIAELTPEAAQPHAAPARPLTVIEHAMRSGATADQLERLLELQVRADNHQIELMREKRRMDEEDRSRDAKAAFLRDLAGFRGENIVIPKSRYVDRGRAGSFMQAEYGTAAAMLSPALSRHGFSFRHDMKFGSKRWMTEGVESDTAWVYVTCYLEHREGHSDRLDLDGPPGDMTANTPVQNMQVTASYLKRQSLLAITGTATQDEDDENKHKRRPGGSEATGEDADARAALVEAGNNEAMNGMAALTAWWGKLTAGQRKDLNAEFGAMRRGAAAVDAQGDAK